MSLFDRLNKVGKKSNALASKLDESEVLKQGHLCTTSIPMINVALSGRIDGGLSSGLLQIVGDSRTFKTCYALFLMSEYMKAKQDSVALFFDSEFGASFEYFDTFGIDKSRVLHLPVTSVEDLTIQMKAQLNEINRGDNVFMFVDSLGLLPSMKETENAEDGKTTADMTRARAVNSLFRIVLSPLQTKNIPLVVINHFYETMALYPQKIIKGGKNSFLASQNIWLISRSKIKDGDQLAGWSFNIRVEKGRKTKEQAVIPVEVTYSNGIARESGLLEVALLTGFVTSPKKGWYVRPEVDPEKSHRKSAMDMDWWAPILENERFKDAVYSMYGVGSNSLQFDSEKLLALVDEETGEILDDDDEV